MDGRLTFNKYNAMRKEELKTQAVELVDTAWRDGHAEGANEAAEVHAKEMAEKQEELKKAQQDVEALRKELNEAKAATVAAYNDGYMDGHRDALNNAGLAQPTEDEVEPQPTPEPQPEPERVPEYTLENSAVEGFMADKAYDAPGFATGTGLSVVDKYIEDAEEGMTQSWTERPAEIPLQMISIEGVEAVDGIYNLVPGREYTYFKNDGGNVVRGKFKTKPNTVRMIKTADADPVVNIRDIGGYKCEGGHVAYEKVLRSATLNFLKEDSVNVRILQALGVKDVITFSSSNPARTDLGKWDGTFLTMDAYVNVLTNTSKYDEIKATVERIIKDAKEGKGVLLHCFAGTDRTGTMVSLILGALGVSEADIIKEWELTCFFCWFVRVRISDWEHRAEIKKECPKGQLRQYFQKLKATYGKNGETHQQQCVAFLKKCGVSAAKIAELKECLVVKATE